MIFQEIGGVYISGRWFRLNESYHDHGSMWRIVRIWAIYNDSHQFQKVYLTRIKHGLALTAVV